MVQSKSDRQQIDQKKKKKTHTQKKTHKKIKMASGICMYLLESSRSLGRIMALTRASGRTDFWGDALGLESDSPLSSSPMALT